MYVQYLNLKKQVNSDASTILHQCLTYCMILNLLIYGTTLLVSVFNFVDYIKIFAIVSIITGSFTLLFTFIYSFFIMNKIMKLDLYTKIYRNIFFIIKCLILGFLTIYQGYTLYNTSEI